MTYLLSFLALWLACGFVAAGWQYAFVQDEWPDLARSDVASDRRFAWKCFRGGVLDLLGAINSRAYRHGWRKWW